MGEGPQSRNKRLREEQVGEYEIGKVMFSAVPGLCIQGSLVLEEFQENWPNPAKKN